MTQNRAKIDRKKTAVGMKLRSHSIDKLNHYDRRILDLEQLIRVKNSVGNFLMSQNMGKVQ
jgi:hypothetical protein